MGTQVFGIKIILQDKLSPVAENTAIGLYNVANDNSEFRWIQNATAGVDTWKEGIIVQGGIKPFSVEIDLRRGGSVSLPGKGSVVIDNSGSFWSIIENIGININGLTLEVWVFNDANPIRIRTYKCNEPTSDSSEYSIPFEGKKHISNILNTVTSFSFPKASTELIGKVIPATFGKLYPMFDTNGIMTRKSMAKFVRTEDAYDEIVYTNATLTSEGLYPEIKMFPVISIQYTGETTGQLGFTIEVSGTAPSSIVTPTDTYMIIVAGNGNGQIRQIDYWNGNIPVDNTMLIMVKTVLGDNASCANDDTRSWVQIVQIKRNFNCDTWKCQSFLSNTTGSETTKPEIYLKDNNDNVSRIADYGLSIKDSNKNSLDIDGSQYLGDIDNVKSAIILPVNNFDIETDSDILTKWGAYGGSKIVDGIYSDTAGIEATQSFSNSNSATDRVSDTYCEHIALITPHQISNRWSHFFIFDLPKIDKKIDFKKVYLGIKLSTNTNANFSGGNTWVKIFLKRFAYPKTTDQNPPSTVFQITTNGGDIIDNLPDEYYTNIIDTNNLNYYYSTPPDESGHYSKITGYNFFELTGISTINDYNIFIKGGFIISRGMYMGDPSNSEVKIYEMAIIFELNDKSMKSEVFSPASGRIFDDTFGNRKNPNSILLTPAEILEHICRLQDYRDKFPTPPSGWGLQYASDALIHTQSFDSLTGSSEPATQIFDLDDGYTENVKQSLCGEFAIANWQDGDGYEKVIDLPVSKLPPAYTVTLDDILDRGKIKVIKPSQTDIFPEPFVNYQKNPATGEYDAHITIKNTAASVFNPTYVDGIQTLGEGQAIWNTCHSLALRTHQIGKPPTDLTDLRWANGAGGYSIALKHLQDWTRWQSCDEIEFPIHFNVAGSWQECTPINIVFSHQTANIVRSALVESSVVNPNHPYDVMIKAIFYA